MKTLQTLFSMESESFFDSKLMAALKEKYPQGFYSDGLYNAIYWDGLKPLRDRVDVLVFNDTKTELLIYVKDRTAETPYGRYELPGGGMETDGSAVNQAINEVKEEVRVILKDVKDTGVTYNVYVDLDYLSADAPLQYQGFHNRVCTATYLGKFTGHVDWAHRDDVLCRQSKMTDIESIWDILTPIHRQVIEDARK